MAAIKRHDRKGDWWIDVRYRGTRIRRRSPVQTRRGAEAYERQLLNEFQEDELRGKNPFVQPPLFSDFAVRWMRDYVATNNKRSTQREKQGALQSRLIPVFGNLRLDEITTEITDRTIAIWRAEGLSAKRVNNLNTILRKALRTAAEWKLIRCEPRIRHLRLTLKPPIYLSRDEYERLIDATDPGFWRTLILFIATTGVRFGEAAALRWEDLHFDEPSPWVFIQRAVEHGYVDDPKTYAGRRPIGLIPETVAALKAFRHDGEWVFKSANDNFLTPNNSVVHLVRACQLANIRRITWHKLRHTVATELMLRGIPLLVIKDILGHKTIDMTARYAHVAPNIARDCIQVLSREHRASTPGSGEGTGTIWSPSNFDATIKAS